MEIIFNNKTRKDVGSYKNKFLSLFDKTLKHLKLKNNYIMSVTIVSKNRIHELNNTFRGIDRPTDVISFAFLDDKNEIINNSKVIDLGEIYICYDICLKNAKKYGNSFDREFCFLFIHGLLHLLGYDHQTKEQEEVMFKLQDEILPPKEN